MKQLLLFLFSFIGLASMAQNRSETYNYKRGVEAVQNQKAEEALDFFDKDVTENPKNGYSYSWMAWLFLNKKDYGRALTAADFAIKYLPRKDAEYVAFSYNTRAEVYLHLADTVNAINDLTQSIKVRPEETRTYKQRAEVYYSQGKCDLADADYDRIIELKPGSVAGYVGKGLVADTQKRWDDAIRLFDHAEKLSSDYSPLYGLRAEAYIGKGKWNEATDDLVKALSFGWDKYTVYLMTKLKEPAFTIMVTKLKVQSAKMPNASIWPYVIGGMYEKSQNYGKAIEYYTAANSKETSPVTYYRIAVCQMQTGDYDNALYNVEQALNIDSTSLEYMTFKPELYFDKGDLKMALSEWDKIVAQYPDFADAYCYRGLIKGYSGDMDGAIEDLSMSIVLAPEDSYSYVSRGNIYMKQGKKDLAEQDFRKIIEIEDASGKYDCIQYAYQGIGQDDKAVAAMNVIIARDTADANTYYNAACLYSRMKNKEKALEYLDKSFRKGYMRFSHLDYDFDMDFIRDTDEYKALVSKYKAALKSNTANKPLPSGQDCQPLPTVTTEIPFVKENGVCKVKCSINGLPLYFVFDTGASDVTVSTVEATFMMKNGYLDNKDVIGSQRYMDANGDINVGTVINLKDVAFGGLKINNVHASVVRSQVAPLLLGQSVLGRLGKIEIDNQSRVIRITHKGKNNF